MLSGCFQLLITGHVWFPASSLVSLNSFVSLVFCSLCLKAPGASLTVLTLNSSGMAALSCRYGLLWFFCWFTESCLDLHLNFFPTRRSFAPVAELPKWSPKTNSFPTTSRSELTCVLKQRICSAMEKLAPLQAGFFFVAQTYQRYGCHSQFWYQKNFVRRVKLI